MGRHSIFSSLKFAINCSAVTSDWQTTQVQRYTHDVLAHWHMSDDGTAILWASKNHFCLRFKVYAMLSTNPKSFFYAFECGNMKICPHSLHPNRSGESSIIMLSYSVLNRHVSRLPSYYSNENAYRLYILGVRQLIGRNFVNILWRPMRALEALSKYFALD